MKSSVSSLLVGSEFWTCVYKILFPIVITWLCFSSTFDSLSARLMLCVSVKGSPVSASSLKARRCSEAFDVVVQPLVSLLVLARASVDLWLAKGVRICLFVCHTAHLTTGRVQCEPRARQCCDQPRLLFFHVCRQFAFQEASVSFFQPCLLRRNSGIFYNILLQYNNLN